MEIQFIHSVIGRYLSCFQVWAIITASVNILVTSCACDFSSYYSYFCISILATLVSLPLLEQLLPLLLFIFFFFFCSFFFALVYLSIFHLSIVDTQRSDSVAYSVSATVVSLLFLEHSRYMPTSRPLYVLFFLPRRLFL